MIVIGALVAAALAVMVGAFGWGWANGTVFETTQERFDCAFDRIVADFPGHSRSSSPRRP